MTGWLGITLIDLFVIVGVGAVLPLALPTRWWGVAAVSAAVAVALPVGWVAAVWVGPWLVVSAVLVAHAAGRRSVPDVLVAGFAGVGGLALLQSRLGLELFGTGEPIVELTAVHFTYAGAGALTLARLNFVAGPHRWARAAVVLTALAPPVVALGFVSRLALPQVGGAVLMLAGTWLTGSLHLRAARRSTRPAIGRVLLLVSGASVWLPMVLAVSWAAAQHWDVSAMSIPDMVRVHGSLNGLGFTLCGLLGWRVEGSATDESPRHPRSVPVPFGARAPLRGSAAGTGHLRLRRLHPVGGAPPAVRDVAHGVPGAGR